jgi:DNA-binding CsgD family transcriptional regulator
MMGQLTGPGGEALARGAWEEARALFQAAVQQTPSPEAFEGLATACWFLDDSGGVFAAREEAYRLYLEGGDRISAARMALALSWDYRAFRGDAAVSNGWLQRAERLLEGCDATREFGWLRYRQAQSALFGEHDPAAARAHTAACRAIAQAQRWVDLEIGALALEGLAFVTEGDPAAGRRCLDEAMTAIVGGEVGDLTVMGFASCHVIAACERTHDYDRAAQWCARLKEFCARWRIRPLFAICRTQYAGICLSRGTWHDAEVELTAAANELAATHPAAVPEALARLGELRRRQGRYDEADALFARADPHPLAVLGRAELALDRRDGRTARELAERYLRRVPPRDRTSRTAALDLLSRAAAASGDRACAAAAAAELQSIADQLATDPLRGTAASSRGLVALIDRDWHAARTAFEDAADLFQHAGLPFEAARARFDRGRALAGAGRTADALADAREAARMFAEIGAAAERERALTLCRPAESPPDGSARPADAAPLDRLTPRERDVLKLVSGGLSNAEIAARLGLSGHTIHRHIANILTKLDLPSRAAAAALAARSGIV